MKKLFSILAVFMLTLTCGVLLSACGGGDNNPNNRKGEKCYVDVVNYNSESKDSKEIYFEYGTNYNGTPNWMGTDDNSDRYWFIKDDVVNFKVYCTSQYYYLDHDFKLVINNELVDMEEKQGYLFPGIDRLYTYFEGSYKIQSNITVACSEIKEKTANVTLKAKSDNELWNDYLNSYPEGEEPNCTKAQYLQDIKKDFYDDSVKIRFEDKNIFGLSKNTWGMNELRNYLITNNVTGDVGTGTGTNIYVYTIGYTQQVAMGFNDEREMESTVRSEKFCYINEQANEYGYKVNLKPFAKYRDDVNVGKEVPEGVDLDKFKNGIVTLQMKKDDRLPELYGRIEELDYVGYKFHADIDEVKLDNTIFSIKYGSGNYGENFKFSDFDANGKLNVQIRLNKYSNQNWKTLYNKMKIKISDKYVNFTISSSGIINLVLDRPYKYFDLAIHGDVPEYFTGDILGEYMYTYYLYFDIIDIAKDAGLVVPVDWAYYNQNWLNITFGGIKHSEDCGLYNNLVARIIESYEQGIIKGLAASDDDMIGFAGDKANYSKVQITDKNNRTFTVNVITRNVSFGEEVNYTSIMEQLKTTAYTSNQEAVIIKMAYEGEELGNGQRRYTYDYYFKVLAGLNVKGIRFYN